MADFCKKCEIELFGSTYLNVDKDEIILCEGCGVYKPYDNEVEWEKYRREVENEQSTQHRLDG